MNANADKLSRARGSAVRALVASLAFFALGMLSVALARSGPHVAFVWLANAPVIAVLVRSAKSQWPAILAGVFLTNVCLNLTIGDHILAGIIYGVGNVSELLIAGWMIRSRAELSPTALTLGGALRAMAYCLGIAIPIAATMGAALSQLIWGLDFATQFTNWWVGDAIGLVLGLVPFTVVTRRSLGNYLGWDEASKFVGTAVVLSATTLAALEYSNFPFVFIAVPLTFIALREGTVRPSLVFVVVGTLVTLVYNRGLLELPFMLQRASSRELWLAVAVTSFFPSLAGIVADEMRARAVQLARNENRFRTAIASAPSGVVLADTSGRIIEANPQICSMLGYEAYEIIGRAYTDFVPRDEIQASTSRVQSLFAGTSTSYEVERPFQHKAGHLVWTHIRVSRIDARCGTEPELIVQIDDVTARRAERQEILRLSERLRVAAESVGFGVWEWDALTGEVEWDARVYALYGVDPASGVKPTFELWRNSLHPDDCARVEADLAATVATGEPLRSEFRILDAKGVCRIIHATGMARLDENGAITHVTGTNWDITELRSTQYQLHAAQNRLQAIIDAATEYAIIATDETGIIQVFSRGAELMLGYAAEELVHKGSPALFHLAQEVIARANELSKTLGRTIEGFETFVVTTRNGQADVREWTYVRKDGSRLRVELSVTTVFDSQAQVIGYLGIARDITARKAAELAIMTAKDEAELASRSKTDFVANMSHEIRTPMNAVLGLAHLLANTELDVSQRRLLDMLRGSAQSLLRLINDVLDFSKIEAGKLEIAHERFNLNDILHTIATIMTASAREKDLELATTIPPELPRQLLGDGLRLQQILVNLTSNAIKFTASGEVSLRVEEILRSPEQVWLRFSVRDTGIGMSREQQRNLFSPFSQVDTSSTRKFGGTGLGLSISQHLAGLMGGSIRVESEPGVGSCFTLELPFESDTTQQCMTQYFSTPRKTLVVEELGVAREGILANLRAWGWDVQAADSCASALTCIQRAGNENSQFDLLIVDWSLPDLDGLATIRSCRQALRRSDVPSILLISGYGHDQISDAEDLKEANAVIVKPATASSLFDALVDINQPTDALLEEKAPTSESAEPLSGVRILLVEDNPLNQIVARGMLGGLGAQLDIANHGLEAVERLRENSLHFDIILMDVQMPVMDGFTATKILREEIGLQIPIIAMTAGVLPSEQARCLDSGMSDFIAKPIDLEHASQVIIRNLRLDQGVGSPAANAISPAKDSATSTQVVQKTPAAFDPEAMLSMLAQDTALRDSVLRQFLTSVASCDEDLSSSIGQNDWASTARTCHTLKGTAKMLGATQLALEAESLEELALQPKVDAVAAARRLGSLSQRLAETARSITRWLAVRDQEKAAPSSEARRWETQPIDAQSIEELRESLMARNLLACEQYRELRTNLRGHLSTQLMEHLDGAVDSLRFDEALHILSRLAA